MYAFEKNGIIIRTMNVSDVSSYVARFNIKNLNYRKRVILQTKKLLKSLKQDSTDLYFVVIQNNIIIGAIIAKSLADSITDASVEVDIPNASIKLIRKVKDVFVEFARDTYIYDDIYFVKEDRTLGKQIPIADSSRWETPK